jgi:hypothetical protein
LQKKFFKQNFTKDITSLALITSHKLYFNWSSVNFVCSGNKKALILYERFLLQRKAGKRITKTPKPFAPKDILLYLQLNILG